MKKSPTTTMIAKEAGVSRASVYAVLNSPENTNIGVSEKKRKLIMDVADKLGYVRNAAASSLRSGKYCSVAVLAQSISNAGFYRFFDAFDQSATRCGYFSFLVSSEMDFARERQKLEAILEQGVDALVVGLLDHEQNQDVLQKYYQRNIPVVVLGNTIGRNHKAVLAGFDEAAGARKIAQYLYQLGYSRFAYFGFDKIYTARYEYFKAACTQIYPEFSLKQYICPDNSYSVGITETVEKMLLASKDCLPDAIVCINDLIAFEVLKILSTKGIQIPKDLSVIGCDNMVHEQNMIAELSTLDLPYDTLAQECWGMLKSIFDGNQNNAYTEPLLVPPQLLIRDTSPHLT